MSTSELMRFAEESRESIVGFLREMMAIPAESCGEEARCRRVLAEYQALGFDEAFFDGLGNVVARIGRGPLKLLFDGHVDCVGVGDPASWPHDPFQGKLEDGKIWGRGAVDELPAIACMAYGMKALKQAGWPEEVTVYLSASVMEEDCDGLALQHLVEQEGIRPHAVILGEPTDMAIHRGHRGRMEIAVTTRGVSAHGAHCERGVNAIYKMAPILRDIEALNHRLAHDEFLGKGTVTVSFIECKTPSLCAVPDQARIWIDRRLTRGETVEGALEEIRSLPGLGDGEVELPLYEAVSWKGLAVRQPKSFPTWVLEESHPLVRAAVAAVETELGFRPRVSRWTFSTNGVATMGRLGIPTVGFAPGREELAHSTGEWVAVDDLVKAAAVYARMPLELSKHMHELMKGSQRNGPSGA
jgi:putative selenium metabolism hydrolase